MTEVGNLAIQQMINAINFSNELIDEIKNHLQELLLFLNDFNEIYKKEEEKLPYHINLIDELHASENAHSRILVKLLQQQEPINKRFEILDSFLKYIVQKYSTYEDFGKIKIYKPEITQEKRRIDLWIRDNNYAIVFENKVGWAGDQMSQLERYIDVTKEYNFKEEQIFVLYLPPTYEKEPDEQTWGKYYGQEIYNKRYLNLSFKDDILPWLKNNVLPSIRKSDYFLSSSIEQYIDHLEGMFSLREINKNMNMELQNFIKAKLGINDVEPEIALKIVSDKREEMENAITQLEFIQEEIQTELNDKYFSKCHEELLNLNLTAFRKIDSYPNYYPRSVGAQLNNKLTVWLGKEEGIDAALFCQVNFNENNKKLPQKVKQKFDEVFIDENRDEDKNGFQIWAYIEKHDNALIYLKEFCEKMSEI